MDKILRIFNRLFVLWVLLAGAVAFFYPDIIIPLKPFMETFFALTMLGVGMVLDHRDFINIFRNFRVILVGSAAQFSIMPLLAFGYGTATLASFDLLKRRALAIEIGMQNAGLGSVLALKHFNERVALPAVIFVFICIFSASILVPIWSNDNKAE